MISARDDSVVKASGSTQARAAYVNGMVALAGRESGRVAKPL